MRARYAHVCSHLAPQDEATSRGARRRLWLRLCRGGTSCHSQLPACGRRAEHCNDPRPTGRTQPRGRHSILLRWFETPKMRTGSVEVRFFRAISDGRRCLPPLSGGNSRTPWKKGTGTEPAALFREYHASCGSEPVPLFHSPLTVRVITILPHHNLAPRRRQAGRFAIRVEGGIQSVLPPRNRDSSEINVPWWQKKYGFLSSVHPFPRKNTVLPAVPSSWKQRRGTRTSRGQDIRYANLG